MRGRYWRDTDIRVVIDKVHLAHMLRYEWAHAMLTERMVVLDVGCGTGYGSFYLSLFGHQVLGIDVNKDVIEWAESQFGRDGYRLEFKQASATDIPAADERFGAVVAFELLEHIADPKAALEEIREVLAPGGVFLFSIPIDHPDHIYHQAEYSLADALNLVDSYNWPSGFNDYQGHEDVRVLPRKGINIAHLVGLRRKAR